MWQRLSGALFFVLVLGLILGQSRLFQNPRVSGITSEPPPPIGIDVWMPVLISLVLLIASVWVILSGRYSDATQKWAFGAAGSILGYWLNTGNH